jgi:Uma2 family endonuclease
MAVETGAKTVEELWKLPDDGLRRELVRGELRVMTPAGAEHGRVTATVGILLGAHVRETASGVTFGAETGFVLGRDPDTVRAPDAAFVTKAHADAVGRTVKYWPRAPDFAVEVVSPDDSFREVEEKALSWLRAGGLAVLVLDSSRRTATVYRGSGEARTHSEADTLDLGDAVPGWKVAMAELFA